MSSPQPSPGRSSSVTRAGGVTRSSLSSSWRWTLLLLLSLSSWCFWTFVLLLSLSWCPGLSLFWACGAACAGCARCAPCESPSPPPCPSASALSAPPPSSRLATVSAVTHVSLLRPFMSMKTPGSRSALWPKSRRSALKSYGIGADFLHDLPCGRAFFSKIAREGYRADPLGTGFGQGIGARRKRRPCRHDIVDQQYPPSLDLVRRGTRKCPFQIHESIGCP